MKDVRVILAVLALSALPLVAASAQGRGKDKPRAQYAEGECKPEHQAALDRARAEGRPAPYGLDKKCLDAPPPVPVPPPPGEQPPTGPHVSKGIVYEEMEGDTVYNMFAGELGIAGQTVQLSWNGRIIAEATSDGNGLYSFSGLAGNTSYTVCVVGPSGYIRTQPVNGSACGGAGYGISVSSTFETHVVRNFGFMLP